MAIVSIGHRLSGVFLFLLIPVLLWALQTSLQSPDAYAEFAAILNTPWVKLSVFVAVLALLYHLLAGCRHMLMDMHIGESLEGGRRSSWMVISLFVIVAVLIAVRIFL